MAAEAQVWPPPLLRTRPRALQIAIPVVGPILFGVLCGWLLGESKAGYLIATTLGILGGVGAGYEHDSLKGGALRGLGGGVLFALAIAETHRLIGGAALADVPDPVELLAVLFGTVGTILGVIGAAFRRRREDRAPEGA